MAARRDLPFPLVIVCLLFIRGYTPLPTTSEVAGINPVSPPKPHGFPTKALVLPPDTYYIDGEMEDEGTDAPIVLVSPDEGTYQQCDYNPCRENQISCAKLANSTGCLCPGFTLYNEIPGAPILKTVSWNGSQVVVHWCAPHSYVTAYIVKVGEQGRWTFSKDQRSGAVGDIDLTADVCVVAENDAGVSKESCKTYHPRDRSLPLKAGLIGGALGFLLLLLLAVLLWRHKRQRKQEAGISMHNTAETR